MTNTYEANNILRHDVFQHRSFGGRVGAMCMMLYHHMVATKGVFFEDLYPTLPQPHDIGMCVELLDSFPDWRVRLPEMAQYSPAWAGIVSKWPEISAFFSQEQRGLSADTLPLTTLMIEDAILQGYLADPRYVVSPSSIATEMVFTIALKKDH